MRGGGGGGSLPSFGSTAWTGQSGRAHGTMVNGMAAADHGARAAPATAAAVRHASVHSYRVAQCGARRRHGRGSSGGPS